MLCNMPRSTEQILKELQERRDKDYNEMQRMNAELRFVEIIFYVFFFILIFWACILMIKAN